MNGLGKAFCLAAAAVLLSGLSAQAAEKVAVHYNDLNLASTTDANTLLVRFEHAAEHVCGAQASFGDLHAQAIHSACVKDAMDHAVASVRSPLVASLYNNEPVPYRVAGR